MSPETTYLRLNLNLSLPGQRSTASAGWKMPARRPHEGRGRSAAPAGAVWLWITAIAIAIILALFIKEPDRKRR